MESRLLPRHELISVDDGTEHLTCARHKARRPGLFKSGFDLIFRRVSCTQRPSCIVSTGAADSPFWA